MNDRTRQKVYIGNKLYQRTVSGIHDIAGVGTYGFVRLAGQQFKVWLVGSGEHSHWNTNRPE